MEIEQFLQKIGTFGLVLRAEKEKLILETQENEVSEEKLAFVKGNQEIINYIKTNKAELIKYFSGLGNNGAPMRSENISSLYRLSDLQEGMLFHGLYEQGSGAYVQQFACELAGVEIQQFIAAWSHLIRHHSILRSSFEYDAFKVPVQCVYKEAVMPVELLDYRQMDEMEQAEAIRDHAAADRRRGFDFKTPPLMRVALLRLSEERYHMLLSHHHIISDGWSGSLLMGEFLRVYESLVTGVELPEVDEDRYEDYIRYIQSLDKHKEQQYWRNYLKGVEGGTLLPFITTGTERNKGLGHFKEAHLLLDESRTAVVTSYAQRHKITVNTLMQEVWAYLLHRYTGSPDIIYGVTVSGRPDDLPRVEGRVGLYINTLPLHSVLEEDLVITEWLQSLQQQQLQSREYQHTGLNKIQEWTGIRGDLFDTLLVFENYPVSKVINSRKWLLEAKNVKVQEQGNYPLGINIGAGADIRIVFTYNADLIDERYIQQLLGHFEQVVLQIIEERASKVGELQMITETERQELLFGFNDTHTDYPRDKTIVDLFYEQAAMTPDNIALVFEDQELTYQQLDERSNQLARLLRSRGVREESLVVICMERSVEMIIAILGILKAGGAYVPIDPDYPEERIAYILEDTAAIIALTAGNVQLPAVGDLTVIDISNSLIDAQDTTTVTTRLRPDHLAYVIYTSGSTGWPKGVMIEHASLVNYIYSSRSSYLNENADGAGSFIHLSYSFDASITSLFLPLITGKRIVVTSRDLLTMFKEDDNLLKYAPYDFIKLTPSHLEFIEHSERLSQRIIVGGEALRADHFRHLVNKNITIINEYGPTESTVGCTIYSVNLANGISQDTVSIGRPIANTQIYILDDSQRLLPIGVTGEICIGGAGLARGYLNRSDLTAEKFIPHPFNEDTRIYRTGDLGRWLPDGNIEFLGRLDDQVKIRGYRIEPGEIESALVQTGLVQQAVVLAKEDQRLIAYIVPAPGYAQESALIHLRAKLPEYMVPTLLVELETLPLTSNGKIDRKALLQIDPSTAAQSEYEAPANTLEEQLARIWSGLLGAERIGRHDKFFQLGGHSLLAMRLVAAIRTELGTEIGIATVFDHPTIAALGAFIASTTYATPALPVITAGARPQKIPLSFSQERLWFIDALGGSLPYHLPFVFRLKGELDRAMLEKSLMTIINRHEVLRTVIAEEDGQPYQRILDENGWQLGNAQNFAYTTELLLSAKIEELIRVPFNLSTDYLLRADLVKTGPDEHVLVGTMHHIVSDGWSIPILVSELKELYNAFVAGRPYRLPELPVQYADYAIWQRGYLSGDILQNKLAYWQQQLSDAPVLQLPTDHPRSAVRSTRGATANFRLDSDLAARLETLSFGSGATLYMTLLSTFNILLCKYTGQNDICIGTPIAGRQLQEVEGLIGFFINTLVIRSQVSPEISFRDLLLQVKKTTLDAYAHQDVPFETIVDAVVTERDLSRNPLFDVLFTVENNTAPNILEETLSGLLLSPQGHTNKTAQFDLLVALQQQAGGITGSVTYNSDLYDAATIQRMITHYQRLLEAVVTDQDQTVGTLDMITEAERQQLLVGFNDTHTDYPRDKTIIDLFYEQAAKTPDSIAVVFEDHELTYRQLDERSNQLAHLLRSRGVREESLVVICMERSVEMIIGILGIFKAGGAYVPVDPEYPQERIAYMLEDTAAQIALTAGNVQLPVAGDLTVINISSESSLIDAQDTTIVTTRLRPSHLAYVIYTSGSTGWPKGVMIEHASLANYIYSSRSNYIAENADGAGSFVHLSYSFDASITSLFLPLIAGKSIVMTSKDLLTMFEQDDNLLKYAPYDFIKLTPSHLEFIEHSERLCQRIIVGGEALRADHFRHLANKNITIINEYGPTESTVGCTIYSVDLANGISQDTVSIGRPISNTQIYILDDSQKLVPVGVTGEICIGGAGLARGYLNRSDLTAEKFIAHPFSTDEDARIYRTGDLGRWLPDGNIEFLGRLDDQVKIRGYRIEPGEIESALVQTGLVQQAVVLAKEDQRLIAYIVPAAGYMQESAITHLRAKLPEYMIPGLIVELDALPLTSNGKIDRKALLQMNLSAAVQQGYEAPEGALEAQLAAIWSDILGTEHIGRHDNFFQLGGHSLLAMRLVAAIRNELRTEIGIATIFDHPTIAALGAFIASATDATPALPTIIAGPRPQKIPLSFPQERLWIIDALGGSLSYHLPFVFRLKGELDRHMLEKAFMTIINRHEVLRTVIAEEDGQPYQHILDENGWQLGNANDFVYTTELWLAAKIEELIQTPFNLATDYLLRADLVKTGPAEHVLAGTMHHIVSDGWSIPILVRELTELYNTFVTGRPYQLPHLPVQYADYAIWQRENLSGNVLENKLAYWQQQLAGTSVLQLPTDHPRGPVRSNRGATANFQLNQELSSRLETLSFESGATLYMTLLSAFNLLLHKYTGQDDICIGTPIAGRSIKEIEGLIGFFVNTLVIRSRVSPEISFRDLLLQVKKTTLDAYAHQDVPFEKIVDAVVTERDLSRNPLFDVLFTLENNTSPNILEETLSGLSLSLQGHTNTTAQFDLSVALQQYAGGITGSVTYNSDLYDRSMIHRMIVNYQRLLHAVAADQDQPVGTLDMITEAERRQLLLGFNDTHTDYPRDKTIIDLFYEQAAKTPGSIAVVFEDHQLTYRQLDERSNQLAHYLQQQGVREESLVVICLERSLEMIIGILGILKAGGAYVPIDPEYPQERIAYMLEDTAASIALTAGNVRLPAASNLTAINIYNSLIDAQDTTTVTTRLRPDHLAYVIYTSGSTGQPKGVMIQHAGLINRLLWAQDYHGLTSEDAVLQKTTYCFDVSVWELLWPLLTGARLVFSRPDGQKDVAYLKQIIADEKITTIHFVPPMLEIFLAAVQQEDCPDLHRVLCSGEALKSAQVSLFGQRLPQVELHNLYGPTEASIDVSYWTWLNKENVPREIPIGKPVANMQLYILNGKSQLSPLGGIGEICIGGIGLARGYLNRPDLTAEKFIPHPFSTDPNARIYRTGDLGRWLPDGNIEYLGRLDDQVKIRGYRIEPGEIESALVQTGLVQQAVVLVREDQHGNKRLVAYIVPAAGYTQESAVSHLREKLPEYMVPTLLAELDTLPLTPNGKTDRKALLQIDLSASTQPGYEAPESGLEAQLAAIWSALLGVELVGRHDNFFQSGGHSLLAMRLVAAIKKELSIQLSIGEVIKNPTIIESANYIKANIAKLVLQNMTLENGHIFPLTSAYKDKIIFFAPSIKGICAGIEELAQALASDFQIYGLQMMGLFEKEIPFKTMEEIAAQNIKWMKTIQPNGPYIFAGHSYAGYIVYEMAKQLARDGEETCLPVIIDITPDYPDLSKANKEPLFMVTKEIFENYNMIEKLFPDWMEKLKVELSDIPLEEYSSYIEKALKNLFPVLDENIEFVIRLISLEANNFLMRYEINEKINGEAIVIAASESPYDDILGWSNYFQHPSFHVIQGDHGSIVNEQGAIEIARIIKEYRITAPANS